MRGNVIHLFVRNIQTCVYVRPEKSDCTRMKEKSALIAEQEEGTGLLKNEEKRKREVERNEREGAQEEFYQVFPSSVLLCPYSR